MNPVRFVFCLHNHQPVGNFDHVIEGAYEQAYLPFVELLADYPAFKFCLHTSGCLLEWLAAKRPEYLDKVRALVDSGQVELLTGAMYEPILPIWPEEVIRAQIRLQTDYLRERFGVSPEGFWLPERVWEPQLAAVLHDAGVRYLPLDDTLFEHVLGDPDERYGYFESEHGGKQVGVFPVAERLRYTIPFRPVEETVAILRSCAGRSPAAVLTYADDGEKFGSWPGTHHHVYRRGWLKRFVEALLDATEHVQTVHFRDVTGSTPPSARITLPAGSYREMNEWAEAAAAQPTDAHAPAGRRSPITSSPRLNAWRNFLVKYSEARRLHRTVLAFTHIDEVARTSSNPEPATRHLLRAQCNCAYWHGVFGGLYLPHLRSALFEELGRARAQRRPSAAGVHVADHNGDGAPDVLLEHPDFDLHLNPAQGGSLDLILQHDPPYNWGCTLTRRPEAYHELLHKPADTRGRGAQSIHAPRAPKHRGMTRQLRYDHYERLSLVDHFVSPQEHFKAFRENRHTELGDFIGARYDLDQQNHTVHLQRSGRVHHAGGSLEASVRKIIKPAAGRPVFEVSYAVEIASDFVGRFGVEWNLTALAPSGPDRWIEVNGEHAGDPRADRRHDEVRSFTLLDRWGGKAIRIGVDRPFELWRSGLYTISQSESGLERVYQQTVFLTLFELSADLDAAWNFSVELIRL
jgi:alpha-amylase